MSLLYEFIMSLKVMSTLHICHSSFQVNNSSTEHGCSDTVSVLPNVLVPLVVFYMVQVGGGTSAGIQLDQGPSRDQGSEED